MLLFRSRAAPSTLRWTSSAATAIAAGHIPVPWYTPSPPEGAPPKRSPYVSLLDYLNPVYPEKDTSIIGLLSQLTPPEDRVNFERLYAANCHHGHLTRQWHPRMSRFIIGHRANTHIIDLEETAAAFVRALKLIQGIIVSNGTVLFVSTRRMMTPLAIQCAVMSGQPYIVDKWVSGFISNFSCVLRSTQKHIVSMNGNPTKFIKSKARLACRAAGVSALVNPPDAILLLNVKENQGAIREAQGANIPIVGICDTDCNPEDIAYPIPANDDNITSVGCIAQIISETIREAMNARGRPIDISFLSPEQISQSKMISD